MGDKQAFQVWLKRRRQERGLTQEQLGEHVGYSGQTIRKIESGQRRPSLQLAMRLAQVLELAPHEQTAWMVAARAVVEPEAAVTQSQTLRTPMASPGLPAYLTPFVGREQEQANLAALLGRADCRLVTLLGQGGAGKTRLAIETARAIAGFPDGIAFVSLAPVAAPQAIASAIGDALGFAFAGASDLTTQLLGYLRDRRAMLILDNLEHLLDPADETLGLLGHLLAGAPGITLLVTSRERLRLAGEWVLEIGGLAVPKPHAAAKSAISPALTLFVEHAQRIEHSFRCTPQNQDPIATICRLVDGLPLGIELAAAWIRMLSVEEIGQELASGLDTEHPSPGMLPQRHHSLRLVVDHSWQLLSAAERLTLCRLSVFQGGFTREAAAQVAGASLQVLTNLADKSLLRRAANRRYDLHEIIRQYADTQLQQHPPEVMVARNRHAAYVLRLLASQEHRLKGAQQASAMALIILEIDNIRAAWRWAVAHGRFDELDNAAEVLQWFYEYRSWYQEGVALFAEAAEQLRPFQQARATRTLGRILGHYGYLAARVGLFTQSRDALAESYRLLAHGSDPIGLSRTLVHQGIAAHWIGDYDEARRMLGQGLALATTTGDRWTSALSQTWASTVAHALGEYQEAERLFRAGLAGWRALASPRAVLWCLTSCSITLMALGKHQEAQEVLRESLALSHATNDRYGIAMALHNLGLAALQQQSGEEAIYFFRESLDLLRAFESWEVAQTLNDLADGLRLVGSMAESWSTYYEALATALEIQAIPDALQAVAGLATHLAHNGQHPEALRLATRVLSDQASSTDARRSAAEVYSLARQHLTAEEAASVEEHAGAIPLPAILAAHRSNS